MKPEHREISNKVIKFVYINLHVQPAILLGKSRTDIVVQARAVAAILMRGCGMSYGQIAEALLLYSRSSVCELIQTYGGRDIVRKDAEKFAEQESRFDARKAFGNSSKNNADHFPESTKMVPASHFGAGGAA